MQARKPRLTAILGALVLFCGQPAASQVWDATSLREFLGFSENDWEEVSRGTVVAKTLSTEHGREVAVVGAARAQASANCFITQFEDIEKWKKSPVVLQVHKFAEPPGRDDFAELTLDDKDVSELRDCRAGDCELKLPAGAMAAITRSGASPDAAFREWLLGYILEYVARGNSALAAYHDKNYPVSLEREFHALLDARPSLMDPAPKFYGYLAQYSESPPEGVTGFLYWSKENFGLRPLISVTDVRIHRQPGGAVISSKQIYANHYFDASLGLTFLLEAGDGPEPFLYIAYLNRSRIDLLGGAIGGLRRFFLRPRLLEGFRDNLRDVVKKAEAACRTPPRDEPRVEPRLPEPAR
jgi:hypothetical protein